MGNRWFKRDKDNKNRMVVQALSATSTRVMFDTVTQSKMGVIVSYFELKTPREDGITGTTVHRIEVEMDLWEAGKYCSQLLASIDAATPQVPRGARRIPFEG